ncbi:SAM-dependent methyltransferase [Streptosporangium sp. DT93]|uniref:SAM-dependent methyltransferase n=1 Tax=Streptosporangium sp. DT93 TaxID=3393428 RepID=UPI003CF87D04
MDDEKTPQASPVDTSGPAVPGLDPNVPNVARIYDYYLGGKDNFAADRARAEEMMRIPGTVQAARNNRAFLRRVVHILAGEGIRQFLDIGAGLPTQENVHQIAERVDPASRTVYVDFDPVVAVHAQALLATNDTTIALTGDAREPEGIFGNPELRAHLDLEKPVAVLLVALTHFMSDEQVENLVDHVRRQVPPGSYLVVTQMFPGDRAELVRKAVTIYSGTNSGPLVGRDAKQIAAWFEGMEMLEPGIVRVERWRPALQDSEGLPEVDEGAPGILGAVGRVL